MQLSLEKFTEDLNKIDFDKITDQNDVNKIYSDFEEAFIQTVESARQNTYP
jgi:hypothetical protein